MRWDQTTLQTKIETRLATLEDVPPLVELLNEVTQWLLSKGIRQWEYPCDEGPLIAQVEAGQVYLAESQGLVGTFSLRVLPPGALEGWRVISGPALPLHDVLADGLYLTRLAVARRYAGHKLGHKLLDRACAIARSRHKSFVYLGCWAGNDKLRAYYQDAGFDLLAEAEKEYCFAVYVSSLDSAASRP